MKNLLKFDSCSTYLKQFCSNTKEQLSRGKAKFTGTKMLELLVISV